jgi:hypothetical protein
VAAISALFRDDDYWAPVPGFGDPRLRKLVVACRPHGGPHRAVTGDRWAISVRADVPRVCQQPTSVAR